MKADLIENSSYKHLTSGQGLVRIIALFVTTIEVEGTRYRKKANSFIAIPDGGQIT